MARSFKRREPLAAMSEINVTPLMDLAFVLLIVFMVAAPLLEEQSIDVQLPIETAKPQKEQKPPQFKSIGIRADGTYFWGTRSVTLTELDALLAQEAEKDDPAVLSIKADASLDYQKVVTLIDMAKAHNLSRISLATQAGD